MGKYNLVASYYNRYTGNFERETAIKINGLDLTKLVEIDKFTSKYKVDELWNIIRKENNLSYDLNTLSIRYIKKNNSNPIYFMAMIDNETIRDCSLSTKRKTIKDYKFSYRTTDVVDIYNEKFIKERSKLQKIIDTRNLELLKKLYPKQNDLSFLIERFIKTSYDTNLEELNELANIINEFSRYKTFRGWIVANLKLEKKYTRNVIPVKQEKKQEKNIIHTLEENEQQFVKEFEEKNNISYEQHVTNELNTRYLDEDKEEFIEEDELNQMGYHI